MAIDAFLVAATETRGDGDWRSKLHRTPHHRTATGRERMAASVCRVCPCAQARPAALGLARPARPQAHPRSPSATAAVGPSTSPRTRRPQVAVPCVARLRGCCRPCPSLPSRPWLLAQRAATDPTPIHTRRRRRRRRPCPAAPQAHARIRSTYAGQSTVHPVAARQPAQPIPSSETAVKVVLACEYRTRFNLPIVDRHTRHKAPKATAGVTGSFTAPSSTPSAPSQVGILPTYFTQAADNGTTDKKA